MFNKTVHLRTVTQFFFGLLLFDCFYLKSFYEVKRVPPESLTTLATWRSCGPRAGSKQGFITVTSATSEFTPSKDVRCPREGSASDARRRQQAAAWSWAAGYTPYRRVP